MVRRFDCSIALTAGPDLGDALEQLTSFSHLIELREHLKDDRASIAVKQDAFRLSRPIEEGSHAENLAITSLKICQFLAYSKNRFVTIKVPVLNAFHLVNRDSEASRTSPILTPTGCCFVIINRPGFQIMKGQPRRELCCSLPLIKVWNSQRCRLLFLLVLIRARKVASR